MKLQEKQIPAKINPFQKIVLFNPSLLWLDFPKVLYDGSFEPHKCRVRSKLQGPLTVTSKECEVGDPSLRGAVGSSVVLRNHWLILQTLKTERQRRREWVPFLQSLVWDPAGHRTHNLSVSVQMLQHEIIELVYPQAMLNGLYRLLTRRWCCDYCIKLPITARAKMPSSQRSIPAPLSASPKTPVGQLVPLLLIDPRLNPRRCLANYP